MVQRGRLVRRVVSGFVAVVLTLGAIAPAQAQTTALNRVMRQKLADAQAVLAAVVTSNWAELERRSKALAAATDDAAWMVLKTPECTRGRARHSSGRPTIWSTRPRAAIRRAHRSPTSR